MEFKERYITINAVKEKYHWNDNILSKICNKGIMPKSIKAIVGNETIELYDEAEICRLTESIAFFEATDGLDTIDDGAFRQEFYSVEEFCDLCLRHMGETVTSKQLIENLKMRLKVLFDFPKEDLIFCSEFGGWASHPDLESIFNFAKEDYIIYSKWDGRNPNPSSDKKSKKENTISQSEAYFYKFLLEKIGTFDENDGKKLIPALKRGEWYRLDVNIRNKIFSHLLEIRRTPNWGNYLTDQKIDELYLRLKYPMLYQYRETLLKINDYLINRSSDKEWANQYRDTIYYNLLKHFEQIGDEITARYIESGAADADAEEYFISQIENAIKNK